MKHKKCKTLSDLNKCTILCGTDDGRVDKEVGEDFKYSAWLEAGYRTSDNNQHIIHADSIAELCWEVNNARVWEDDPELND